MEASIEVKKIRKTFQKDFWVKPQVILDDVSFSIHSGRVTGFIGNNGAGKTTTLKCVLGFLSIESGEIYIRGKLRNPNTKISGIGFLSERPYIYPFLTGVEFLQFHSQLNGKKSSRAELLKILERVDLARGADKLAKHFSKGMLQRLGLAQALLGQPEIMILDEPMSGLDPDGRILFKQIIKEEADRGATIFFSSHLLIDVEELSERLVIMDGGKVLFEGELSQALKPGMSLEESFKVWKSAK